MDGYRVMKKMNVDAASIDEFSFSPAPSMDFGAVACADLEMQVDGADGLEIEASSLVIDSSCGHDGDHADQSEA